MLLAALFLAAASINTLGQSPKSILKKATKAIGKTKALKSIQTMEKRGLIIRLRDGASGNYAMQTTKPGLYHSKFDLRGFETEAGFNGKSGWIRDSREGLKTLTGKAGEDFKAEADYRNWGWINLKRRKFKASSGGKSEISGKPVNSVFLANRKGVRIKLFFDASTNLLLREEIPAGDQTKVFDYSDYRDVQGLKQPFQVETNIDDIRYAIKFDQVSINKPVSNTAYNFPRISGEPLPDIPTLLKELRANEDRVEALLENYSYTEKTTKRKLDKNGILRETGSETYQISFYRGNQIRRMIAKNGKTLTPGQQKKEDKAVEKRVKQIERSIKKDEKKPVDQTRTGPPERDGRRISIAEVLRASKLTNPRREVLQSRKVIVFDFEPNPDFDFKNAKSFLKFFGKTAGAMWIDEEDKQVARLEAVLFDAYKVGGGLLAKLRKGASFTLEKQRFNDEVWLPSIADINLSIRVLLVGGVKVNSIVESTDYRRFKTDVKDAKVNDIKN